MDKSQKAPDYVRYVPAQAGAQPKIIRMFQAQKDPMEPARFKINQKIPGPPPSPPAPVMHSPPRKITAEEQNKWKIPPCVSSWKNPRGYTIPLDKRCAFDGRNGAQPEIINPKFAQLSETLYISTRQHRDALEEKMKADKLLAQKELEKQKEKMRLVAQRAREDRANTQRGFGYNRDDDDQSSVSTERGAAGSSSFREGTSGRLRGEPDEDVEGERERSRIRDERHRERVRNANIKAGAPNKRTNLDRMHERDISEQIALGMARPNTVDNDIHDQRLYNQSQGLDTGFGEEDDYAVYDKAWKTQASFSTNYRPSESLVQEARSREEREKAAASETSTTDKQLPKMSREERFEDDQLAPIEFEKDDVEDVFNVESFLRNAKYNANKSLQKESHHSSKRHKS